MLRQLLQRHPAARRLDHLIALRAQSGPQQFADRRLVVDDEDLDGSGHAALSSAPASAGTGRRMVSTAPLRSPRLAAAMVPCMASTNPREIARPRPVPARTWSAFCTR